MPRKNNNKKPKVIGNLTYRGLGLEPGILDDIRTIAFKDMRKINPMINILLKEAIAARKAA